MANQWHEKYSDVDIKSLDPFDDDIEHPEECDWLIYELTKNINSMASQIKFRHLNGNLDQEWLIKCQQSMAGAKATRQALYARRGELARKYNAFIDEAEKVIDEKTWDKIWEKV